MNGNATAKQDRFHSWARRFGCIIEKAEYPSIHHIAGSKAKLKGVKGFGEWFIIPLSYWHHQDGQNPAAFHISKTEFIKVNCMTEKDFWIELMNGYKAEKGEYPMPEHEYQIIVDRG
jgi:hypothetical protein